jgi:hypothetical protein
MAFSLHSPSARGADHDQADSISPDAGADGVRRESTTPAIREPDTRRLHRRVRPTSRRPRAPAIATASTPDETTGVIATGSIRCERGATATAITTTTAATDRATSTNASTAPRSNAATGTVTDVADREIGQSGHRGIDGPIARLFNQLPDYQIPRLPHSERELVDCRERKIAPTSGARDQNWVPRRVRASKARGSDVSASARSCTNRS